MISLLLLTTARAGACAVPARLADAAGMRAVFAVFCPVWLFGPEMLQSL